MSGIDRAQAHKRNSAALQTDHHDALLSSLSLDRLHHLQTTQEVPSDTDVARALAATDFTDAHHHVILDDISDSASSITKASADNRQEQQFTAVKESTTCTTTVCPPVESITLPPQFHAGFRRELTWRLFSVYRKIFFAIFLANISALALRLAFRKVYKTGSLMSDEVGTAVSANLMVAILVRNEHVINLLFHVFTSVPLWTPLMLRRSCAMIYSYGGFHSGCTIAASVWFCLYTALVTVEYQRGEQSSPVFIVLACMILALLLAIICLSMPKLRAKYHNSFEAVHRFAGWSVIGLFWAQLVAGAILKQQAKRIPAATVLVTTPLFWFLTVTTVCVIYPWARLRRREIEVEPLSDHAVRLHFDYGRIGLCSAIRLADRPFIESHAFATIPRPDGRAGFSCVVSKAGDWTDRIVKNPPEHLYTRSGPTSGMAMVMKLFQPVVIIATGSGIGPCLAFFVGMPRHNCRIIWSTRNPEKTYGTGIIRAVLQADRDAFIIDTDLTGRPDLVALAYRVYVQAKAEAICIISNKNVTTKVVYEMESRGIPAYGPIWDS